MKKTMKKCLAGLLAMGCLCCVSFQVSAEETNDSVFVVETESFTYTRSSSQLGGTLESNIECEANFMIVGVFENKYAVLPLTWKAGGGNSVGYMFPSSLESYIENAYDLDIGDLLYINDVEVLEVYPPIYYPLNADGLLDDEEETVVEYVGYGVDIFGSEFVKVMRHEAVLETERLSDYMSSASISERLDVIMGDTTEDEKVGITDVIMINKVILGKEELCSYAQYVSDINKNGKVDSEDTLNVIKYIVGLTDSLDE